MADKIKDKKQIPCVHFKKGNCKNEACPYLHSESKVIVSDQPKKECTFYLKGTCTKGTNCKFYHSGTQVGPSIETSNSDSKEVKLSTKTEPCAFWSVGKCKKGDLCAFLHPPRKPILDDILEHKSSIKATPDINEGITDQTPSLPGLPPLPPNGKCRVMLEEGLVIYFIPFFKPIGGIVYYKKIRLFRFNKQKQIYKLVFAYTRKDFHITTASASNGFLVCSRLPYDASVLKMMEEAKNLRNKNEKLSNKLKKKDSDITKLKKKNRYLSDKIIEAKEQNRKLEINNNILRQQSLERQQALERQQDLERQQTWERQQALQRQQTLENQIFANIRSRDPVDIFVYDPVKKAHVHVLEYHKPADHVHLEGKILNLWDKKSELMHTFEITMLTKDVNKFDLDDPLQPKSLCKYF